MEEKDKGNRERGRGVMGERGEKCFDGGIILAGMPRADY